MKQLRKIIEIDEEKCTGCGQCIIGCAEGALALVDGKAKLVGEILCDGLGACIGECPEDALKLIEREADEFDEAAVEAHLAKKKAPAPAFGGCPSSQNMVFQNAPSPGFKVAEGAPSSLGHWPTKLQLLGPGAPFLKGADLVLLADCVACAYPDLHAKLLPGRAVAMGCPKLDNLEAHIQRLTEIIKHSGLKSLTVAHMEVPCCSGFVYAAQEALKRAGANLELGRIKIGRDGSVLEEENLPWAA